jgi:hypothetical protein
MTEKPNNQQRFSRSAVVFVALLVTSGLLVWTFGRAELIAADWHGWRQADTQVIALHFTEPGSSILYPRIDWGGAGPGYVEAEFQLYPWLVSRLLIVTGHAEWPGQLVSLLAVLAAAVVMWRCLFTLHGPFAAIIGALTVLTSRSVMYVATAIQPEALCLLLYVLAWSSFLRWHHHGSRRNLVAFAAFGGLAMLVKPTAAQLGITSFVLLALGAPKRLRTAEPWVAWAAMLIVLGAHLFHGRQVYDQYGNSFGVFAGGDSKLPMWRQFIVPRLWLQAALQSLIWGLGPLGSVALLALVVKRRMDAVIISLVAGNAIWTLLALRYTSGASGTHYHIMMSVLAAHAVGRAIQELSSHRYIRVGAAVAWVATAAFTLSQRDRYTRPLTPGLLEASAALARNAPPGTLVIVRSGTRKYAADFHTLVNYQDPRVHYNSRTRGWVLALDDLDPRLLEDARREGARFYVEPEPVPDSSVFDPWLERNAVLVARTSVGGRIFRL